MGRPEQRKALDQARGAASPLRLDLIDSLVSGQISRRDFLRRGAILGVAAPTMASVLAACAVDPSEVVARQHSDWIPTPTPVPTATPTPLPTATPIPTPTAAPEPTPVPTTESVPASLSNTVRAGVQFGDVNVGLDPLNMLDLGTYAVVSQSFEYLVGIAGDGFIAQTGLAQSWSPNEDATTWTFALRPNVQWHDGSAFTSRDVAATIERLASTSLWDLGLAAAESPDDLTVVVRLDEPNGNLPVRLSTLAPQAVITPADYSNGTRLNDRPAGTGPWIIDQHDPQTFTTRFVRNPNYWGRQPALDEITLMGFETAEERVQAFRQGEIDVMQDAPIVDGSSLRDDRAVTVLAPPSINHRQVWFNTQFPESAPVTNALVRQAIAYCIDRDQIVDEVFKGQARVANDHPVHPSLPFFDADVVLQRTRDLDRARTLLANAGVDDLVVNLEIGDLDFNRDLARVIADNCAEAGIAIDIGVTPNRDFYGDQWCPGASFGRLPDTREPQMPCGWSAQMGIVDYGHRATPDTIFHRSLTVDADWNSSNYVSEPFERSFRAYQRAVDVAGQRAAIGDMQRILHEDTPVIIPAFFDYLVAHQANLVNVEATSFGHLDFTRAAWR